MDRLRSRIYALLVLGLLAGCTREPRQPSTQSQIGPQGGTVTLASGDGKGASITVPAGALKADTVLAIGVAPAPRDLPEGIEAAGPVLQFGPSGTRFDAPVTITVPTSDTPTMLMTADGDHPGWSQVLDATYDSAAGTYSAAVSHFSQYVAVKGMPRGVTLSRVSTLTTDSRCNLPNGAAVGDFTGDGKLDVAVTCIEPVVALYVGKGDGTFTLGSALGERASTSPVAVDFNRDGKLDLVAINSFNQSLVLFTNQGGGALARSGTFMLGAKEATRMITADLNRDGNGDLAVSDGGGAAVLVLLGDGKGGFAAPSKLAVGGKPTDLAAGDLNRDGKLDLVIATNETAVPLRLGNGDGTFRSGAALAAKVSALRVAPVDFNGDGWLDLLVGNGGAGNVGVTLLYNGGGAFIPPIDAVLGGNARMLLPADLNNDRDPDLTLLLSTRAVAVAGAGVKGLPGPATSVSFKYYIEFGAAADFNNDGKIDVLAMAPTDPYLHVLLNTTANLPPAPDMAVAGDMAAPRDMTPPADLMRPPADLATACSSAEWTSTASVGTVAAADALKFGTASAFTVSFTARITNMTAGHVFVKGDNATNEWSLTVHPQDANTLCLNRQGLAILSCYPGKLGNWHQYAMTYANGAITWYEDGVKKATGSGMIGAGASSSLKVGNYAAGQNHMQGRIDSAAIWSKALADMEIFAIHAGDRAPASVGGLVAHWLFDEGSGTTVADSSGNGRAMTLQSVGWARDCR